MIKHVQYKNDQNIRSFVRREKNLTPRQRHALEALWPIYGVSPLDINKLLDCFDRSGPLVAEIGFGMGDSLIEMAKAYPENNYLGIEVYRPGIGALLASLEAQSISNVRVCCVDAAIAFRDFLSRNSLDRVQIFFPDPWPKRRHNKRRLINPCFLDRIMYVLKEDGILHVVTDAKSYSDQIKALLNQARVFKTVMSDDFYLDTKYRRRAERLGHALYEHIFQLKACV